MADELQVIANLLDASLDPSRSSQAEQSLKQEQTKPEFSIKLLQIISNDALKETTRLAGALFFKNFVKRNWVDENGAHFLPPNEVSIIKNELIGLMVRVPPRIQAQLGDAISIIAESDFYERWDTLVTDLVSRLTPDDATTNNGVLKVAHSIFKRWEPLYRTDELYTEINHVLSTFAEPLLQLWGSTHKIVMEEKSNAARLRDNLSTLDLILKLVYDLSTHDMPPQFEENLETLLGFLRSYLDYSNPLLDSNDDEPGPIEVIKAGVLRVLIQYAKKYEEETKSRLKVFIDASWQLLTTLDSSSKYDLVVSRTLEFLTSAVAGNREHAQAFESHEVLSQIIDRAIIPNLTLRESDEERFEDEPIEFIRQDLEGADDDTRRRAATNFLRALMEQFEGLVTSVVNKYVESNLARYAQDKESNWKFKDVALHLFSSIAAKGHSTAARGVLTVNPYTDVISFFQNTVAEDLVNDNAHPLLKVDAIKYLYTFRSILSAEQWQQAFPLLVQHLDNSNYVVYTYAAIAVDRALYLTTDQGQAFIPRDVILPYAENLLKHLYKLIQKDTRPEKVQENEFLVKCIMRVLVVIREGVVPIASLVLNSAVNITRVIRHNPSNPGFCYYHFECIGALIRFASETESAKIEAALFPVFEQILEGDVEEFSPYVYQLLASAVLRSPSPTLSAQYQSLLTSRVLKLSLWDRRGDVPALTKLLCNLIQKVAGQADARQVEAMLVIFQKLISSKAYELHAFELIEAIITSLQLTDAYWKSILELMLSRLQSSRTERFEMAFVRFYHLVSASTDQSKNRPVLGADFFIKVADQFGNQVFTPIYTQMVLPDTQKLSIPAHRKTAVISLTRTLADSEAFVTRYANRGWTITCAALLQLLINPPLPAAVDDAIEDRDVDDLAFGAAYTPLATCKRPPVDLWPEVQDVRKWVGATLREADGRHGGRIGQFVANKLDEQQRAALGEVMTS